MKNLPKMSLRALVEVQRMTSGIAGFCSAMCVPVLDKSPDKFTAAVERGMEIGQMFKELELEGGENQKQVAAKVADLLEQYARLMREHLKDFDK